jgi:hypothetical protein
MSLKVEKGIDIKSFFTATEYRARNYYGFDMFSNHNVTCPEPDDYTSLRARTMLVLYSRDYLFQYDLRY